MAKGIGVSMKKSIVCIVSLMLVLGLSGCNKAAPPQYKEVSLVLDWVPNVNHVGFYVALEKGYYEEEGIALTIQEPPEDGALPLLASGKGDFAICAQEEMASAFDLENPFPITSVAAILAHNTSGIVSLKENNINRPKELENKQYATWGSPVELALLEYLIEEDGGSFENVDIIYQQAIDVLSALHTGVDAVWIYYGTDGVLFESQNIDITYLPIIELEPKLDYYTPLISANNQFLDENEDTTKAFLRATKKGYLYAKENPKKAADILHEVIKEAEYDVLLRGLQYLAPYYMDERWGVIEEDRWNYFFQFLKEKEVLTSSIPENFGFTNQYLE